MPNKRVTLIALFAAFIGLLVVAFVLNPTGNPLMLVGSLGALVYTGIAGYFFVRGPERIALLMMGPLLVIIILASLLGLI